MKAEKILIPLFLALGFSFIVVGFRDWLKNKLPISKNVAAGGSLYIPKIIVINGTSFLSGEGFPPLTIGNNGDTYLDVLDGNLYKKVNNIW